jgi:hypothetical protein
MKPFVVSRVIVKGANHERLFLKAILRMNLPNNRHGRKTPAEKPLCELLGSRKRMSVERGHGHTNSVKR